MRVLRSAAKWASLASLLLLAPACASSHSKSFRPERLETEQSWLVVRDVPVVRQTTDNNCGAASMSMVLGYWGSPMTIDEISTRLPAAPAEGFQAGDLRDLARERGMKAFVIAGDIKDLRQQLEKKRPVLVGVVKRTALNRGLAHYVVVVGYDAENQRILTLDPARGWREDSVERFMKEWEASGRLALVAFPGSEK